MKQPSTADMLVEDMNKNGTVELSIHPEHFSEISDMFEIAAKLKKEWDVIKEKHDDIKEQLSLKYDEIRLAVKKAWMRTADSYDDTMKTMKNKSSVAEINIDRRTITFRSQEHVKQEKMEAAKDSMPNFLKSILGL